MNVTERIDELLSSGFIKERPLVRVGDRPGKSFGWESDAEFGFSSKDADEYLNRTKTLNLIPGICTEKTKKKFLTHGLNTPAEDFIVFHEISHKRFHENCWSWKTSDKDCSRLMFMTKSGPDESLAAGEEAVKRIPRELGAALGFDVEKVGNGNVVNAIQNLFQESYADVMAIHLSSQKFGDSPSRLSDFLSKMRAGKKSDDIHDGSFGLKALSLALSNKEFSERFVSDRDFAEGVAIKVSKMNCVSMIKKSELSETGAFADWLSELQSAPLDVAAYQPVRLSKVPSSRQAQPGLSDVGRRIMDMHSAETLGERETKPTV